jgi:hypothetical protein
VPGLDGRAPETQGYHTLLEALPEVYGKPGTLAGKKVVLDVLREKKFVRWQRLNGGVLCTVICENNPAVLLDRWLQG